MEKKIFWILFTILGLCTYALPFWWAVVATVPCFAISWWVAYKSEWF